MDNPVKPLFIALSIVNAHLQLRADILIICKEIGINPLNPIIYRIDPGLRNFRHDFTHIPALLILLIESTQIDNRRHHLTGYPDDNTGLFHIIGLHLCTQRDLRFGIFLRQILPDILFYALIKFPFCHHNQHSSFLSLFSMASL